MIKKNACFAEGSANELSLLTDLLREHSASFPHEGNWANREILSRVIHSVPFGLILTDTKSRIQFVNSNGGKMFGYSRPTLLGQPMGLLVRERSCHQQVMADEAAENPPGLPGPLFFGVRKDGSEFPAEMTIDRIDTPDGTLMLSVVRDITEQRRAEETSAISELRYRRLFESAKDGILILDAQSGMVTDVNPYLMAILGFSHEQFLGKAIWELGFFRDVIANENKFVELREKGYVRYDDLPLETADGRRIEVEFVSNVYVVDGVRVIQCNVRDITARRIAEQAARRERALLRAVIDNIPDLIFYKDKDSLFLGCNKAFAEHMGKTEEEIIGQTDFTLVPKEIAELYQKKDREMLATGAVLRVEELIPAHGGKIGYFDTVKTPYYGPDGESLGLVGVSRDVTDRKEAEENRRLLSERLKLATEAGQMGIWEIDLVSGKMDGDRQMRELYGLPTDWDGDLAQQVKDTIHPEDRTRVAEEFDAALLFPERPLNTEFRILPANGAGLRFIRGKSTVVRSETGRGERMVGINWDVTAERKREDSLLQALSRETDLSREAQAGNRAKSEFLAVMSHEIRTPMNGILGFAALLGEDPDLPEDCRNYARTIASCSEALQRILDDILDSGRLDAGKLRVEKSLFVPQEILADVHNLMATRAREKNLDCRLVVEEGGPARLWNDPGRLRQVLLNLVGNAIKFTPGGSVTLGMRKPPGDECLEIYVRDTGPGINEEDLRHVFEPFTQADSSISRRYGGTGLGLSISQSLAGLMGGSLTVESKVGTGSEFTVSLPLGLPQNPLPSGQGVAAQVLDKTFALRHPNRILLVEDDGVNRQLMGEILLKLGYEILVARDGREAVEIFDKEHPNCILMDLQMPNKDGLQATVEIRAKERTRPVERATFIAALTADVLAEDRQRCLEAGMDGYLNKPIKRVLLEEVLEQASERMRAERS